VISVGANRRPEPDPHDPASGTGGFSLYAESSLPVLESLDGMSGRSSSNAEIPGAQVVAMRVRDGDDASCLNLNRAQTPRLLGVPSEALAERRSFSFGQDPRAAWRLLQQGESDDVIPGIADEASAAWALGKKLGDEVAYTDERGRPFRVKLVALARDSILQGSVLIDEAAFVRRFPSLRGHRAFLIDAPLDRAAAVAEELSRQWRDRGLEVVPAAQRLRAFREVQDTYISIFQALGGLGLLLGSLGLGAVVLRNILERRRELAMLRAVGFTRAALTRLLVGEHALLLLLGLACGAAAAAVAVWPALRAAPRDLPYRSLAVTLAAVLACGLVATWLATRAALRRPVLTTLREE
jgi:predicted lysophospholipase L1 biosynthesis ABC-type transport system permease subunit